MKRNCLLSLALILVLNGAANSSPTIPLNDESYDWVYQYMDYLYSRGLIEDLHYGTRPYTQKEIMESVIFAKDKMDSHQIEPSWVDEYVVKRLEEEFPEEQGSEENRFNWEVGFSQKFKGVKKEKPTYRENLTLSAGMTLGQSFSARTLYVLDEDLAKDITYTGKVWRGYAGDASQSYINFDLPKVSFFFGRDRLSWGESRFSPLILSQDGFPIDMFRLEGGWGIFKFSSFAGILSPLEMEDSSGTLHINRFMSGHRLSFKPWRWLGLGFSETVVYGGTSRNIEFYYAIPFIWYHGVQLNEARDDNTFLGLDFNLRPVRGVVLYGEFLIDDVQIENKEKSDREPDELGFVGGASVVGVFLPGLTANVEYQRITNWTYNQAKPYNRYLHKSRTMGSSLGTDADVLRLSLSSWIREGLKVSFSYLLGRQGEGRVDAPWSMPWMETQGEYKEKFPTGEVQETKVTCGYLEYDFRNFLRVRLSGKYTDISNQDNIEGKRDTFAEIGILLFCRLGGSK